MGQYTHPTGVGFGGQQPSWSNRTLQKILKACQRHASKVVVIDIHSGLGPFGEGLLLSCSAPTSKDFQLAQQWFGSKVMAVKSDPNLPYSVNGDVLSAVIKHFPDAESIAIALEYGTFDVDELMNLQIDDTWCRQFAPDSLLAEQVKEQLWGFFYPDSVKWQRMVLEQGEAAFEKAMQYLAA
jgi:DNA-binding NarL/FixJ family response regulator